MKRKNECMIDAIRELAAKVGEYDDWEITHRLAVLLVQLLVQKKTNRYIGNIYPEELDEEEAELCENKRGKVVVKFVPLAEED